MSTNIYMNMRKIALGYPNKSIGEMYYIYLYIYVACSPVTFSWGTSE